MRRTRRYVTAASLLVAFAGLAACSSSSVESSGTGTGGTTGASTESAPADTTATKASTELRIVSTFASKTFPDPASDYVEPTYGNSELLLRPTGDGPKPWLAESLTQTDDTTWKVVLRKGLKFQNGDALDAAALVRWYDYDSAHDNQANSLLAKGTTFIAVDDVTVDIKLPEPYQYVPYALANYTNAVYDSDVVESVGGKFEDLAGKGIFTGPYAYTSTTGDEITYTANPNYYQGKPRYETLTLRVLSDASAGLQAIESGEADAQVFPLSDASRQLGPDSAAAFISASPAVTYTAAVLDASKAPFDEQAVRQAFALAIDNAGISTAVTNGVQKPLSGIFPDSEPLNVAWKTYDVKAAEAALDAAGWVKGADGIRQKDGKPLKVVLATYFDDLKRIGTAVIGMLHEVGFDATLNALGAYDDVKAAITDSGSAVNAMLWNGQNYGYAGNKYTALAKDYDFGNGYDVLVNDPDLIAQSKILQTSLDPKAVDAALTDAQKLNGERVYYVPIVENPTSLLVGKDFAKVDIDPFGYFFGYDYGPDAG